MQVVILAILVGFVVLIFYTLKRKTGLIQPTLKQEKQLLQQHVSFFQRLPAAAKEMFEASVRKFLQQVRITGVKTTAEDMDTFFIAAAAIIPISAWKNGNIGIYMRHYCSPGLSPKITA